MTLDEVMPAKEVVQVIAKRLSLSELHVRNRILKGNDFPEPCKIVGSVKVYSKKSIEEWFGIHN